MNLFTSLFFSLFSLTSCQKDSLPYSNQIDDDKMLLVITPPSIHNHYYADAYDDIVAFDIAYAKHILGKDNVIVLGDAATIDYLKQHLPEDILLQQNLEDIWLRDCSMVMPYAPIQFRYAAAAQGNQADADYVQEKFNAFANKYKIKFSTSPYTLDGGNFVDNYNGRAILSDRFLEDNHLTYQAAKAYLKQALGLNEVAIIPNDDPNGLAHADGQVMFIDNNTIAVTDYNEPAYQQLIHDELRTAFPGIKLLKVPTIRDTTIWDARFGSSCGVHINSTVTKHHIYLPVFGNATDDQAIQLIQRNSSKTVVPIDASLVCRMGGSVRCLSWQVAGENAKRLIEAARQ